MSQFREEFAWEGRMDFVSLKLLFSEKRVARKVKRVIGFQALVRQY